MRKPYLLLLILLGISFLYPELYSQDIKNISFKKIGLEEKLSSVYVRKSVEDKNGFIWISTQDGLNKYDGNKIIQFTKNSSNEKKQILGSDCFDMNYSKGDTILYVINSYDGLNCININTNEVVKKITGKNLYLSNNEEWLKSMTNLREKLFIATNNKIIHFDKSTKKTLKIIELSLGQENSISEVFTHKDNICAILLSGEIFFYDSNLNFKFKQQIVKSKPLRNVSKYFVHNNNLWLTFNDGIQVHDFNNPTKNNTTIYLKGLPAHFFSLPSNAISVNHNKLYFSNNLGCFVYNFFNNSYYQLQNKYDETVKDYLNGVFHFLFTSTNMFIGGVFGLAEIKSTELAFRNFYIYKNEKIENCYSIKKIENHIYTAAENAFYKTNIQTGEIENILDKTFIYSFCSINKNQLLVSATNRLVILENGKEKMASNIYHELKSIQKDLFIGIEKLNDSIIILASETGSGFYAWNIKRHILTNYSKISNPSFSGNLINNIYKLDDTRVLIIGELYIELFDLVKQEIIIVFRKDSLQKRKADVLMDLCSTSKHFWIAAYGLGIIQLGKDYKVQKIIGTAEGLNNAGGYKIFQSQDSLIIVTTNNGLSVYNINNNKIKNYFKEDGLHGNVFNELSGFNSGDSIYVGGLKGFSIFDAKKYKTNNIAPSLFWAEINVTATKNSFDTTNLFLQNISIPNNTSRARINFSALNYSNSLRVEYFYRIKELSKDWISLGNQNFVDLFGLQPKKYSLEVKAANEDGVECKPVVLKINWLPHWYQTLLFKILTALAIIGLLYLLYSFRIRQLKRILTVRKKISADLHDDIGSTLSSINMYSQIAQLKPNDTQNIQTIQQNTQEALQKLDDIVWATNPKNDQIKNLVERIKNFGNEILKAKNINFNFDYDEAITNTKINEATRQNLFLICKEAVNNIAKYAQAKNCTISMYIKHKTIYCTITDDGIGFDTTKPTERNGILNMQLRTQQLKGKFVMDSVPNKGTTINVQLLL